MIEVCCEYLSVRSIWLYFIIMSHSSFRVKPRSIVCVIVKELLARRRRHIWILKESNDNRTENHFVRKGTINNLTKVAKWLRYVVRAYLYFAY